MFDTIGKKLSTIFPFLGDLLSENPTAAEIDNALDDVIAATKKADKGTVDTANETKIEELEKQVSDLTELVNKQGQTISEMNDNFSKILNDDKEANEEKIQKVSTEVTQLRTDVSSDIAKIKTAKTQDLSTQQKEVNKKEGGEIDKKEGEEGERKIVTFDWMN